MTVHSLLSWVIVGNVARVKDALEAGADPNQKDERGYSALHLAVSYRKKEVIPLLIERGALVDLKNPEGDDALDMAARRDDTEVLDIITHAQRRKTA